MILPILGVTTPTDLSKININFVPQTAQVQPEKVEPTKYTVLENDSLTKIADKHQTTWQRLWQKNTHLTNQDILNVGEILVIPSVDEVLADRPLYTLPVAENVSEPIKNVSRPVSSLSKGNDMTKGYCTWHVKNLRPDLPSGLGNANTWYSRAKALGLAVGSTPQVGAVATTTRGSEGHVSYVLKVEGNRIFVSEMNVAGWNVQSNAWYDASAYKYIY